jgi:hypothetical protein
MDDAIDQMNQIASGREAHQNQRSSFVELRRGFAASRQGDARGWDWETGDRNSGDFIDLQGHEQNPRAQRPRRAWRASVSAVK